MLNKIHFSISVEDFNAEPVRQVISSDATDQTGSIELDFIIPLVDDDREERKESLLLWLNASVSDGSSDSVTYTANRRCIRVDITPDQDGELEHELSLFCVLQSRISCRHRKRSKVERVMYIITCKALGNFQPCVHFIQNTPIFASTRLFSIIGRQRFLGYKTSRKSTGAYFIAINFIDEIFI